MITLETLAEVVRPYNEKLLAEARVERLERSNADLLAALIAAEQFLHADMGEFGVRPHDTKDSDTLRIIRAAIAKATGGA